MDLTPFPLDNFRKVSNILFLFIVSVGGRSHQNLGCVMNIKERFIFKFAFSLFVLIAFGSQIYAQTQPHIKFVKLNDSRVNHGDTIVINDFEIGVGNTITFEIEAENRGNDSPSPFNNITVSFPQFEFQNDKHLVDVEEKSSDLNYNEFIGNEPGGGDGIAEFLLVESQSTNTWEGGAGFFNIAEDENLKLTIQPKSLGLFEIRYRVGMGAIEDWNNQWTHLPATSPTNDSIGLPVFKITVDLRKPARPEIPDDPDLRSSDDSGVSDTDNITNDNSPRFTWPEATSITGVRGYYWAVNDNSPESGGTFTTSRAAHPRNLSDGTHRFYVKAVGENGLFSANADLRFRIDTTSPTPPQITKPTNNSRTIDDTPEFCWNPSSDRHLHKHTITVDEILPLGLRSQEFSQDVLNSQGTNCFTTPNNLALTAGGNDYEVSLQSTDIAGNTSSVVKSIFFVDNPFRVNSISVTKSQGTVIQNQSFSISGTISGVGNGQVSYKWVSRSLSGNTWSVWTDESPPLVTTMTNGVAVIGARNHTIPDLKTYELRAQSIQPNTTDSNSISISPVAPIVINSVDVSSLDDLRSCTNANHTISVDVGLDLNVDGLLQVDLISSTGSLLTQDWIYLNTQAIGTSRTENFQLSLSQSSVGEHGYDAIVIFRPKEINGPLTTSEPIDAKKIESFTLNWENCPDPLVLRTVNINRNSIRRGDTFEAIYEIENPNNFEVEVGLGCSIENADSNRIDDPANDINVVLMGGETKEFSRTFNVPEATTIGAYDVLFGLWETDSAVGQNSNWIQQWDLETLPSALNVCGQAAVNEIQVVVGDIYCLNEEIVFEVRAGVDSDIGGILQASAVVDGQDLSTFIPIEDSVSSFYPIFFKLDPSEARCYEFELNFTYREGAAEGPILNTQHCDIEKTESVQFCVEECAQNWGRIEFDAEEQFTLWAYTEEGSKLNTFLHPEPEEKVRQIFLTESLDDLTQPLPKELYLAKGLNNQLLPLFNQLKSPGWTKFGKKYTSGGNTSFIPQTYGAWQLVWGLLDFERRSQYKDAIRNTLGLMGLPIDLRYEIISSGEEKYRVDGLNPRLEKIFNSLTRKALAEFNEDIEWEKTTLLDRLKIVRRYEKEFADVVRTAYEDVYPDSTITPDAFDRKLKRWVDVSKWLDVVEVFGSFGDRVAASSMIRIYLSESEDAEERLKQIRNAYEFTRDNFIPDLDVEFENAIDDVEQELEREISTLRANFTSFFSELLTWETISDVVELLSDAEFISPFKSRIITKLGTSVKVNVFGNNKTLTPKGSNAISSALDSVLQIANIWHERGSTLHRTSAYMTLYNCLYYYDELSSVGAIVDPDGVIQISSRLDHYQVRVSRNYALWSMVNELLSWFNVAPGDWYGVATGLVVGAIDFKKSAGFSISGPIFEGLDTLRRQIENWVWSEDIEALRQIGEDIEARLRNYVARGELIKNFLNEAYLEDFSGDLPETFQFSPLKIIAVEKIVAPLGEITATNIIVSGLEDGETIDLSIEGLDSITSLNEDLLIIDLTSDIQLGNYIVNVHVESSLGRVADEQMEISVVPSERGSVSITIEPDSLVEQELVSWRIKNETSWLPSGFVLEGLDVGDYLIEFRSLEGWKHPDPIQIVIMEGEHIDRTVSYEEDLQSPVAIIESISPNQATPGVDIISFIDGSYDPDEIGQGIIRWQWSSDLEIQAENPDLSPFLSEQKEFELDAMNLQVGNHTITLMVTDNEGISQSTTATLRVLDQKPEILESALSKNEMGQGDNEPILLTATAWDLDEQSSSIESWQLKIPGEEDVILVSGSELSYPLVLSSLEPNDYNVSVFAVDDEGSLSDEEILTITINEKTESTLFIRGDVNSSGKANISDAIALLNYMFFGKSKPTCLKAADSNDSGEINITDPIHLISTIFLGEPSVQPFPNCGVDPTEEDELTCMKGPDICE